MIKVLTIDEVKKSIDKVRLEGTMLKIMSYIKAEESQGKVFTKRDLLKVFDVSSGKVAKSLRQLAEYNMVGKIKVGRTTYYGSDEAIDSIEGAIKGRSIGKEVKE
ncbi:MAG: hypothetical protein MASP_01909 [Candidatus Methanolliviera sp. GoM_asphalt]|nr:MAG: hypothetical protein MASP_01909 [Candidatus Methanolliviera sp. GoM_asphalt]